MEVDYPKTRMDNFYAKAAGSDMADTSMKPITDREYWINELAARLAEGGLVPPIEEGDDGKVLTASDGQAVWASGGGSSDPYAGYDVVIEGTPGIDQTVWSLIKGSYEDASTLYEAGNPLNVFVYVIGDDNSILTYVSSSYMAVEDEILNIFITIWDLQSATMSLQLLSDNTVVDAS